MALFYTSTHESNNTRLVPILQGNSHYCWMISSSIVLALPGSRLSQLDGPRGYVLWLWTMWGYWSWRICLPLAPQCFLCDVLSDLRSAFDWDWGCGIFLQNFLNPAHVRLFVVFFSIPCRHPYIFQMLRLCGTTYVWLVTPFMASFHLHSNVCSHICVQSNFQSLKMNKSAHSFADCWLQGLWLCFPCRDWPNAQGCCGTWLWGILCIYY